MWEQEQTNSDIEDLLHEVVEAIDGDKYFIVIARPDRNRTVMLKSIPNEDAMIVIKDLEEVIWQTPE